MTGLATNFVEYFKGKREAALETLVRVLSALLWAA